MRTVVYLLGIIAIAFIALIAASVLAYGQDYRDLGGDELQLTSHGHGQATLWYLNSGDRMSANPSARGVHTLQDGGMTVSVQILVGGGQEALRLGLEGGCEASPPSPTAMDGEEIEVLIQCGAPGM